jgi:hypothetical protein
MERRIDIGRLIRRAMVISCMTLLAFGSSSLGLIRDAFAGETTVDEAEKNDTIDSAQDLGTINQGDSMVVKGKAGSRDPGTYVQQLENECGLPSDLEDFYKFKIAKRANVRIQVTFTGATLDFDEWLFKPTADKDRFPEGAMLIGISAGPPGDQEEIGPVMLEAGEYVLGVDAFDDPGVDVGTPYTLTITIGGNQNEFHVIEDFWGGCTVKPFSGKINGLMVVDQFEPTQFPAVLDQFFTWFFKQENAPAPAGVPIRLIAFNDPDGNPAPPGSPTLAYDLMASTRAIGNAGDAVIATAIPNPPRFEKGKVYVGFVLPDDAVQKGLSITLGRSIFGDKTFISSDGGKTWQATNFMDMEGVFTASIFVRFSFPRPTP